MCGEDEDEEGAGEGTLGVRKVQLNMQNYVRLHLQAITLRSSTKSVVGRLDLWGRCIDEK